MTDLTSLTAQAIVQGVSQGKLKAVEMLELFLAKIQKLDPKLKVFITITGKEAREQATEVDRKVAKGEKLGRLAGVPIALKDIYLTKGIQTTAGSQVLKDYIPQYSSTLYNRLMAEDAVLVGKTNTDTFAFGASTENSGFFTSRNPWDPSRVPGGSSGGSAVSVAADMTPLAMGTDTGGSIRQPSSLCGISGIKPTYGRNSRYGITAMASSFDCPGAFARHVSDLALVTSITAGLDPHDSTTSPSPVPDYLSLLSSINLKGLRIALPKEYFPTNLDPVIATRVMAAVEVLKKQGALVSEVSLPSTDLGIAVYYILVPSEISSNMARYDGLRFGQSAGQKDDLLDYYLQTRGQFMEPEMKRRIMIGTYALSSGFYDAYYEKASRVRTLIKNEFAKVLAEHDVILAPVSPMTAWKIGEKVNDPLAMYLADVFTSCVNVAGLPSLALPCGFDRQNLPIGFQLIGNYFDEAKLFSIGHQYQQLTDFHLQRPKL